MYLGFQSLEFSVGFLFFFIDLLYKILILLLEKKIQSLNILIQ